MATILFTTAQSFAYAENTQEVEIVNETQDEIMALYIVPSGISEWGRDLIGATPLGFQDSIIFMYDPEIRYYDIKMKLTNGKTYYWRNDSKIDFAGRWRMTIYFDGSKYHISKNAVG